MLRSNGAERVCDCAVPLSYYICCASSGRYSHGFEHCDGCEFEYYLVDFEYSADEYWIEWEKLRYGSHCWGRGRRRGGSGVDRGCVVVLWAEEAEE